KGNCDDLAPEIISAAFRIIQECLSNAAKHANATTVAILVEARPDVFELVVKDDGLASSLPFKDGKGIGLVGIRERVSALGGELNLSILDPGGLLVRAILPLQIQTTAATGKLV
ncbi:MAG: sensor histidine kinase, partial [Methylococcales bacterium]|nr:sensor histidine kinase [Methylococcales bacterium]